MGVLPEIASTAYRDTGTIQHYQLPSVGAHSATLWRLVQRLCERRRRLACIDVHPSFDTQRQPTRNTSCSTSSRPVLCAEQSVRVSIATRPSLMRYHSDCRLVGMLVTARRCSMTGPFLDGKTAANEGSWTTHPRLGLSQYALPALAVSMPADRRTRAGLAMLR